MKTKTTRKKSERITNKERRVMYEYWKMTGSTYPHIAKAFNFAIPAVSYVITAMMEEERKERADAELMEITRSGDFPFVARYRTKAMVQMVKYYINLRSYLEDYEDGGSQQAHLIGEACRVETWLQENITFVTN